MKKPKTEKRIMPSARLAAGVFIVVGLCELFVMAGGLEIPTSFVARTMPFAVDPFLRLTGEHPDSTITLKGKSYGKAADEESGSSALATAAGLSAEELSAAMEEPILPITNMVEEPLPAVVTNESFEVAEPPEPKEIVPVG